MKHHRRISHFSGIAFSVKCGYIVGKVSTEYTAEYTAMHEILLSHGYELVDDAWEARGHRTYVHDGKADNQHMAQLEKKIRPAGWVRAQDQMRMFRHKTTSDIIELEPGGSKIQGHFLHHMKWESM